MPLPSARAPVFATLIVLAVVVVLIDDPWLRSAVALIPLVVLARMALGGAGAAAAATAAERSAQAARAAQVARDAQAEADRRSDMTVRRQIQDLLDLIREFYTTCHMVAIGQLEPSKAKAKALVVETKLNEMTAQMLERVDSEEESE